MFASKTWHLRGDLNRWFDLKRRVCYVNTYKDTRSDEQGFSTHSSCKAVYNYPQFKLNNLELLNYDDYDVIGVDEGQFHTDLPKILPIWLKAGKRVIISALKATSENACFPVIANILSYVNEFVHLKAICTACLADTGNDVDAIMTRCLVEKKGEELIGGDTEYVAVCFKHYFSPTLPSKLKRSLGASNWPSPPKTVTDDPVVQRINA